MPHIRLRAIAQNHVQEISQDLIAELSALTGSPEDHFTLECVSSHFFFQGKKSEAFPFVEVLWFARPQEIQDSAADIITRIVRAKTQAADIVVIFTALTKNSYYENGKHF